MKKGLFCALFVGMISLSGTASAEFDDAHGCHTLQTCQPRAAAPSDTFLNWEGDPELTGAFRHCVNEENWLLAAFVGGFYLFDEITDPFFGEQECD